MTKKDAVAPSASSSQSLLLPVNHIKKQRYDSHHLYEVELPGAYILTNMRLYFGQAPGQESVHYKLIIKIFGGQDEKLLYFNTFEE